MGLKLLIGQTREWTLGNCDESVLQQFVHDVETINHLIDKIIHRYFDENMIIFIYMKIVISKGRIPE